MNKDQFIQNLNHPELLDDSSLTELGEVIREFPYCQPAQLLFLKNLQNEENIRFNKQLKLAAVYSNDRKLLYDLLHLKPGIAKQEPMPDESPEQPESVHAAQTQPAFIEPKQPDPEIIELDPGAQQQTEPKPEVQEQNEPEETEKAPQKDTYLRTLEKIIPIVDIDLLVFDFPSKSENELPGYELEREVPEFDRSRTDGNGLVTDPENRELIRDFIHSDPFSRSRHTREPVVHHTPEPPPVSKTHGRKNKLTKQDELINRFVAQNKSHIIRPAETSKTEDLSLNSLKEDEDLLTETLARIYVQQGYHLKAIQAYEKLSLKYPEKSVFFASRIDYIKELIKNQ